jgi:hypothetical protein
LNESVVAGTFVLFHRCHAARLARVGYVGALSFGRSGDAATGDSVTRSVLLVELVVRLLFDSLVCACEQTTWHSQSERLGGFQIEDHLDARWLQHRQVHGLRTVQDLARVGSGLLISLENVGVVAHQSSDLHELAPLVDGRHGITRGERDQAVAFAVEMGSPLISSAPICFREKEENAESISKASLAVKTRTSRPKV